MSKSFVINQAQSAVCDIVEAVENKFTDEDYLDVEEPGYFVTKIDQVGAWKISGVFFYADWLHIIKTMWKNK